MNPLTHASNPPAACADRPSRPARIWAGLALALTLLLPGLAAAQALDEVQYADVDKDAVLRVHFNVRLQLQRYAPQVASDLFEIYVQVIGGDESMIRPVEESLSTPEGDERPQASVILPVQPGSPLRKLVVRLDRVTTFKVRPGADNQTLEIVFPGRARKPVIVPVETVDRNRYAVSLERVPLAERDSLRAIPKRMQNYTVFGTQRRVAGADYYELDLGFFDTRTEAEAALRDVLPDFPRAEVFDVVARKAESLREPPAATTSAPAVAPASAAAAAPAPAMVAATPVPASAPAGAPSPAAGSDVNAAPAGAASGAPAIAATTAATSVATGAASSAATGAVEAAASAAAPAIAAASATTDFAPTNGPRVEGQAPAGPGAGAVRTATAAEAGELERQAGDLMRQSREALAAGHPADAIPLLNQLLLLPPNRYSQDAQELVGLARERSGEPAQARKEYELYLKLFPEGDGARRVRQRLASIAPPEAATTVAAKPVEKREPSFTWGGSLAQAYYGGNAATQTAFLNVPTLASQQSISNSTQSSMVSSLDLNARYRGEANDTRVVVRDTDQKSFLEGSPSINRLDAAYVDVHNDELHGSVRVGRQAGVTGGLVGRFDGVSLSYDLPNRMRVNAVAGDPVDKVVGSTQRFEGVNLEAQNITDHVGATGFLINQTADGVTDRRAVGGDMRYFEQNRSLYALFDYDVNFHAINAVTVQGNYQLPDLSNLSLLFDDRKAPTLATSNGLIQFGCANFAQAYAGACSQPGVFTLDTIKTSALATTANSRQAALDFSHPFNTHWTASADLRLTNVGKLPTVTINGILFPGTDAGTGNVTSFSLQTTGSNLYSRRDISVVSLSLLKGPIYHGQQLSLSNLNGLLDNLVTIEPNLSYYRQVDTAGGTAGQDLTRIAPGVHGSYKLGRRMSLDATVSSERTRYTGPTQNSTTRDTFFYLGYRLDLH